MPASTTPEVCPNCGTELARNAKACPECGSCEETGWSQAAEVSALGLPGEEFDYNDFVAREFTNANPKPRGISWGWWVVGIVLLVALGLALTAGLMKF